MKKVILFLLLSVALVFAQDPIFLDSDGAACDTATVDSSAYVTGCLIVYGGHPEGVATLFMAGDSVSGTSTGVYGQYQLYYGKNEEGDSLWGVWTAFEDSVLLYSDVNHLAVDSYDSGAMTGRETDLGSVWVLASGVRFRFIAGDGVKFVVGYLFFY